jgi:hypothetical protein
VNEDRARQGVEHLQTAALEVIAALRSFLDVAEDLVRDPSSAAHLATSLLESARSTEPADGGPASSPDPRVTRIRVS